QGPVGLGQGAGQRGAGAAGLLLAEEEADRLVEAPRQQALEAGERDLPPRLRAEPGGEVVAVQGVQEEQGPAALGEVVTAAAELLQVGALPQQVRRAQPGAELLQRPVAGLVVAGEDGGSKSAGHTALTPPRSAPGAPTASRGRPAARRAGRGRPRGR